MRAFLGLILFTLVFSSCATNEPAPATKLEKPNVLPLSLNDHFQIRKTTRYFNNDRPKPTLSEPVQFERRRMDWGAVNNFDYELRYGNYFTFFWRATERADVTIRLEYRQAAVGNYVMAQERYYPGAKGSFKSHFQVIGDDYREFGRVTSWRVILIVDGRIVALKQSYIWR